MNIGSFALPASAFIFFVSLFIALAIGWLFSGNSSDAVSGIFNSVLTGLAVARISFVLHYLPSYHGNFLKMLDFRDLGFDPWPGAVAGGLVILWLVARRKNLRIPLLGAAVAGVVVWNSSMNAVLAGERQQASAGAPIPTAVADGPLHALAQQDGTPHVVNLWASWCGPCQAEMPLLADTQAHDPRIKLFFVNQGETPETVRIFLLKLNLHIVNSLFDPDLELAKSAGVVAYPTTLFYDASGRLIHTHLGLFSPATLKETLDRLYPPADSRRASSGSGGSALPRGSL